MADGGIDPATWATIMQNTGMWGPNKFTSYPDKLKIAGLAGKPTDAQGKDIPSYATDIAAGVDPYKAHMDALSNPGHVTTPGGYDHSADTPSVLDAFRAAHAAPSGAGTPGAGGYNNQSFFDTLNNLRGATGSTAASGKSPAQWAQEEVDARNAKPPEAPTSPNPAPVQGTTLNTAPAAATGGMGGSEAERQLAGWGALDPVDIGPNALRGLDNSFGSSMATQPLGQRVQNAQAGNIGANMPQSLGGSAPMGGALSSGGMGSQLSPATSQNGVLGNGGRNSYVDPRKIWNGQGSSPPGANE